MDRFWDAWNKSTIVSGVIAVGLLVTVVYLAVVQAPIPEAVSFAFGSVVGFFFGSKGRDDALRAIEAVQSRKGE